MDSIDIVIGQRVDCKKQVVDAVKADGTLSGFAAAIEGYRLRQLLKDAGLPSQNETLTDLNDYAHSFQANVNY